jgi:hypothetical protein
MSHFQCPSCQAKCDVAPDFAGKSVVCPRCGKTAEVPRDDAITAGLPTSPLALPPLTAVTTPDFAEAEQAKKRADQADDDDRWRGQSIARDGEVPRSRPAWVYFVFGAYLLLVTLLFLLPGVALAVEGNLGALFAYIIVAVIVLALGASLLAIPIGKHWELPTLQKSIVLPLIGSATCAALIFLAASLAAHEFVFGLNDSPAAGAAFFAMLIGTLIAWVGWAMLFAWFSRSVDPTSLNDRIYQCLVGGSVLELLIAIPMHLYVRRRGECCAGIHTGLAIGIGVIVMIIALGPAVFFLFFRRYQQAYAKRRVKDAQEE